MDDLYSDSDPEYRATRVKSGIPPPSSRDQRRQPRQGGDLSQFNPAMQRHQHQQRYSPYGQQHDQRREHRGYHDQPYSRSAHEDVNRRNRYPEQQQQQRQPYPDNRYQEQHQRQPYPEHQQQQQQHHQRQPEHHSRPEIRQPQPPKPKPLDLRTSTDFLKCEKRQSLEELIDTLQLQIKSGIDYDFLSSKGLVEKVNQLREKIRHVPVEQRSPARSKSNPFERIGNSIFMNRAATKLAALDATFALTQNNGKQEFTFADICGGPGGFSEYLLWRIHSWGGSAHGFGITLKASDEVNWHTEKFRPDIPRHSLTEVYGPDGTGDLYKEENIRAFEATVLKGTEQKGVDLAVADGGFDFSGNEEQQEILAQRLLLCEVITMLTCLKQGGHFVCKFFDMLSETTASLVWLLYQLFDEVCITKPLSSRPANAERYIVCKGLVYAQPKTLIQKLIIMSKEHDLGSIVSRDLIEKDEDFTDYIKMRNMKFAMKQSDALEQLDQFIKNPDLPPLYDQEQVKRHCLNEWRLPLQDSQHYF